MIANDWWRKWFLFCSSTIIMSCLTLYCPYHNGWRRAMLVWELLFVARMWLCKCCDAAADAAGTMQTVALAVGWPAEVSRPPLQLGTWRSNRSCARRMRRVCANIRPLDYWTRCRMRRTPVELSCSRTLDQVCKVRVDYTARMCRALAVAPAPGRPLNASLLWSKSRRNGSIRWRGARSAE